MPGSSKWLLPSSFPSETLYSPLLSLIRATCPAHLSPWLDHPNDIWWGVQSIKLLLCSLLHSPVTSSLSLHSSLNVSDQVSHPYKTTGKIIVLYILIFMFLDSKLDDKRCCTEL
jgi:hypothetical protein